MSFFKGYISFFKNGDDLLYKPFRSQSRFDEE
jgi:hypothetical protein